MEEWVLQKLKDNFKGSIVTDAATVEAASTDASIFKVIPAGRPVGIPH